MQFKNINYCFTGDTFLIGKRSMEVIQRGSDSSNSKKDCKTEKYNRRPITILLCFSKIYTNNICTYLANFFGQKSL